MGNGMDGWGQWGGVLLRSLTDSPHLAMPFFSFTPSFLLPCGTFGYLTSSFDSRLWSIPRGRSEKNRGLLSRSGILSEREWELGPCSPLAGLEMGLVVFLDASGLGLGWD